MLRPHRNKPTVSTSAVRAQACLGSPRLWLFDMDDTLYSASAFMFDRIHALMENFIAQKLQMPVDQARAIQNAYWSTYGATFLGLERHHNISPDEFLGATHRFDVASCVTTRYPKARLRRTLTQLPGRKVLLTNGPRDYARTILQTLRLQGVFESMTTSSQMHCLGRWRCKPDKTLLRVVTAQAQIDPSHTVLVEDNLANLRAAKALGMKTVWCVGYHKAGAQRCARPHFVDAVIHDVSELPSLVVHKRPAKR